MGMRVIRGAIKIGRLSCSHYGFRVLFTHGGIGKVDDYDMKLT